jgi:membrane protein
MKALRQRAKKIYDRMDRLSGGMLGIIVDAFRTFGETQAAQAAAGMAYYAMFSLFPLIIALIAAGSFLVNRDWVMSRVVGAITGVLQVSTSLIEQNVTRVFQLRGAVGAAGLVGLIWSASGVFSSLVYNVNRAWDQAPEPGFIRQRLMAVLMVIILILLMITSVVASSILSLLSSLNVPIITSAGLGNQTVVRIVSTVAPFFFILLMFLGIYRWIPTPRVSWRAAAAGAALATAGWGVAAKGFQLYLTSGLVNYQLVYGSLGAIVALLFYIYISSQIALFGAHLTAFIDRNRGAESQD